MAARAMTPVPTFDNHAGETRQRPTFASKFGTYITCLGCAVGTGNIWRFPRIVANNSKDEGGLVFLIVWLLFLGLWSIPMLIIEYGLGRYYKKAVIGSIREFISEKAAFLGGWIVLVSFFIACYYSVILGWCLYYCGKSLAGLPETPEESRNNFQEFAEDSYWPALFTCVAITTAVLLVAKGVKVIEKVSTVMVLFLIFLIVVAFFASLSLPHAGAGVRFLVTPDCKSFWDLQVWIDALSQNAFDSGAGLGLMMSYASYMTSRDNVVQYSVLIPVFNNIVSLFCGVTIFASVFATLISTYGFVSQSDVIDILMKSGPGNTGLTFIWLPVLFNSFDKHVGRFLSFAFFLCTSVAGLTSLMAYVELFTLTISDFGLSRKWSLCGCLLGLNLFSLFSSLDIKILNNQDFVWGIALVLNGLVFVGLVISYGAKSFRQNIVNDYGDGDDWNLPKLWQWVVWFVLPLEGAGIVIMWAVDLIVNPTQTEGSWDEFGERTFATAIAEWLAVIMILLVVNLGCVYLPCCHCFEDEQGTEVKSIMGSRTSSVSSYDSSKSSQASVPCAKVTHF